MGQFLNYNTISATIEAALDSEFVYENIYGFSTIGFYLNPPTGGAVAFQGSFDGINYFSIHLRGIENNLFISETDTAQNIIGSIAGLHSVKIKVISAGSNPGDITGRVQIQQAIIEGVEDSNQVPSSSGIQGILTVGTTAVEVKIGSTKLVGRKFVTLFNNSNTVFYWGFNNSVTINTGTPIYKDQFYSWNMTGDISIFVIAGSNNLEARITESA
jgi:hypothetical protein